MLLSPQLEQKWRHSGEHSSRSMGRCMTTGTKRQHQAHHRFAGHPMMHNDGPFIAARGVTNTTAIAVTFQDRFAQTTEVFFILPLQRVAGRTQAQGNDPGVPRMAMYYPLTATFHFPAPAAYRYKVCRLMLSSLASAVFDSPVATRRRSYVPFSRDICLRPSVPKSRYRWLVLCPC
jgi:hypothetical protein